MLSKKRSESLGVADPIVIDHQIAHNTFAYHGLMVTGQQVDARNLFLDGRQLFCIPFFFLQALLDRLQRDLQTGNSNQVGNQKRFILDTFSEKKAHPDISQGRFRIVIARMRQRPEGKVFGKIS